MIPRHSGEGRNPAAAPGLDPGFRRGDAGRHGVGTTIPVVLAVALVIPNVTAASAEDAPPSGRVLPLEEFIERAVRNDTEFEEILVDHLTLRYQKDLALPPRDLVLEVREELELSLDDGDVENDSVVALSRLFPMTGTAVSASYQLIPGSGGRSDFSSFTATVAQPIAENAFGRSTKLLDRIVGLEIDVARHQIIEAYEDYMALIVGFYLDWYEAYENLRIGQSSHRENLRLLDNMRERRRSQIALPIDVNKVRLQVLEKKEQLTELEIRHESRQNLVERVIRHDGEEELVPSLPTLAAPLDAPFEKSFEELERSGRTLTVFRLLEDKSSLEVARDADDLLPSIDLLLTFRREGQDAEIRRAENEVLAGFAMTWPFTDQVQEAEHAVSKIGLAKAELATENVRVRLETDLRNLRLEIERERRQSQMADEKTELAASILDDEAENYSFARVTLNDYIQAVNTFDANRFNQIRRYVAWRKLLLEWLRLTDRLVSERQVRDRHERFFDPDGG